MKLKGRGLENAQQTGKEGSDSKSLVARPRLMLMKLKGEKCITDGGGREVRTQKVAG